MSMENNVLCLQFKCGEAKAERQKITIFSNTATAWPLVNLNSHINLTSIWIMYLSSADSKFGPNANDFCGMRFVLSWIYLVKHFSLVFEGEKRNLVNCCKCLCSKITAVLIVCATFSWIFKIFVRENYCGVESWSKEKSQECEHIITSFESSMLHRIS